MPEAGDLLVETKESALTEEQRKIISDFVESDDNKYVPVDKKNPGSYYNNCRRISDKLKKKLEEASPGIKIQFLTITKGTLEWKLGKGELTKLPTKGVHCALVLPDTPDKLVVEPQNGTVFAMKEATDYYKKKLGVDEVGLMMTPDIFDRSSNI